jgi:hypothetical protein
VTVPNNGNQSSDSNGSVASVDRGQQEVDPGLQLQVLVAWKAVDWTAGAAEADTAAVDMRPENVQAWFTKVIYQSTGISASNEWLFSCNALLCGISPVHAELQAQKRCMHM